MDRAVGSITHLFCDLLQRIASASQGNDLLIQGGQSVKKCFAVQIGKRMGQLQAENAIFAFVIKALLIFLAINGKCTVWFALFVDMAAAIGTVLNSIRVTQDSLLAGLQRDE